MTRVPKVFKVEVPDTPAEPIPFTIEFVRRREGSDEVTVEEHTFEALGSVGAGGFMAVTHLLRYDDRGRVQVDMAALMPFFQRVLPPADFMRLTMLLDRQDLEVPMSVLADIFNDLSAEYSGGRPTERPSVSSNGRPPTGPRSMDKPSSVAAI